MKEQPKAGYGMKMKIAVHLGISTVMTSQILSNQRQMQMDQAYDLASFMGLAEKEKEYFLLLIQQARAGKESYRQYLTKQIKSLLAEVSEVNGRVTKDIELDEIQKAQFYSHWHYSAVRLTTAIRGKNTVKTIADHLILEPSYVNEILQFLLSCGLVQFENGKYHMGVQSTFLPSNSPWIYSRQMQWRQKSVQAMERNNLKNLFYTGPMVISREDGKLIRDQLVSAISKITATARDSGSEELMCLLIDWFAITE